MKKKILLSIICALLIMPLSASAVLPFESDQIIEIELNGAGGYAWVCDGCYFCIDYSDPSVILDTYVHCDWGWGGNSNGYYSGSVFSASSYNFTPQHYFAIQREW